MPGNVLRRMGNTHHEHSYKIFHIENTFSGTLNVFRKGRKKCKNIFPVYSSIKFIFDSQFIWQPNPLAMNQNSNRVRFKAERKSTLKALEMSVIQIRNGSSGERDVRLINKSVTRKMLFITKSHYKSVTAKNITAKYYYKHLCWTAYANNY